MVALSPSHEVMTKHCDESALSRINGLYGPIRYAYIPYDPDSPDVVFGGVGRKKRRCLSQLFFGNRRIFYLLTSRVICEILVSEILTAKYKGGDSLTARLNLN